MLSGVNQMLSGLSDFRHYHYQVYFSSNFVIEKKMLSQFFLALFEPYGLLSAASNYF